MKTNASVTQIMSYHDLDLNHKQHEVITAIRDLQTVGKKASCESIADHLGYEKNRVTGRIAELRDKGAIDYDGFTLSKYNRNIECYKLVAKGQSSLI